MTFRWDQTASALCRLILNALQTSKPGNAVNIHQLNQNKKEEVIFGTSASIIDVGEHLGPHQWTYDSVKSLEVKLDQ